MLYGQTSAATFASCLNQVALDVPATTPYQDLKDLSYAMLELLESLPPALDPTLPPQPTDPPGSRVFGLSAPQYGVGPLLTVMTGAPPFNGLLWRVFVLSEKRLTQVGIDAPSPALIFINPTIIDISTSNNGWQNELFEECLSLPVPDAMPRPPALIAPVKRAGGLTLRYHTLDTWDHTAPPVIRDFNGPLAHLIQHELDHLNGKLPLCQWSYQNLQARAKDIYDAWFTPRVSPATPGQPYGYLGYPHFRV